MPAYSKAFAISHIYAWISEEGGTEFMYEAVISCERTVFFSNKNNKIRNLRNSSLDCGAEGVTAEKKTSHQ